MIEVPDLDYRNALWFCKMLDKYKPKYENEKFIFDFSQVNNCDPFPMLMVSNAIRHKREQYGLNEFARRNCNNGYANHMKFYRACGIDMGEKVETTKGNSRYRCITKLTIKDLYSEGAENLDSIQETISKKAVEMANVLAMNNNKFGKWIAYMLREVLRNIPEHSKSETIWYCAQCWPNCDLVELSILDEGIGIMESLKDCYEYRETIDDDYTALLLALEPGVSGTFAGCRPSIGTGEWKNSGYGLYMVSQMCAELGASFIIASGNSAIRVYKDRKSGEIVKEKYETYIRGTAIQIRIRPSQSVNYEEISAAILKRGEKLAKNKDNVFHSASKSSRGFI